jgi:MFS family permease
MEDVGETWLMMSLGGTPFMVALVQASASLPAVIFALPAGALADIVDRRSLLVATQAWMAAVAALLGVLTLGKHVGPWGLLACTFAMGVGSALDAPAYQAVVGEVAPRQDVPRAVVINELGLNVARIAGPALGGVVVASVGAGATFLLNALTFLGVLGVLLRWRRHRTPSLLPTERLWAGVRAGLRYVRDASTLRQLLLRTFAVLLSGSALWALLPSFVSRELAGGPAEYGSLLAALGMGAVTAAVPVSRARERFGIDAVLIPATLMLAGGIGGLAASRSLATAALSTFVAGAAWLALLATSMAGVQQASAEWVRARALAAFLLISEGALLLGSIAWGWLATRTSIRLSLGAAAAGALVSTVVSIPGRLRDIDRLDRSPAEFYPIPSAPAGLDLDFTPIVVEIVYAVDAGRRAAFLAAMEAVGRSRRRTGAALWMLTEESEDPSKIVEWFVLESWNEHHRQHGRWTKNDEQMWKYARSLVAAGTEPRVSHLVQIAGRSLHPTSARLLVGQPPKERRHQAG